MSKQTKKPTAPQTIRLCNEAAPFQAPDFSKLTIPYGNYPITCTIDGKTLTAVQKFTPDSARDICTALANAMQSGKSKGLPIYQGHPDSLAPEIAAKYPDKRAYGWIAKAEATPGGLDLFPAWNEEPGDHFSHISPYWLCRRSDYRVSALLSIGLVNNPNIPDLRLANESPGETEKGENMKELMIALGLAEDAGEADAIAAVKALQDEVANLTTAQEAAAAEKAAASEALANERAARVELALDCAMQNGQVTAAGRPAWKKRLTEDPAGGFAALANEKPHVKTAPKTGGLTKPAASHSDVIALANEKVAASGGKLTFLAAYGEVKKEHPEYFAG